MELVPPAMMYSLAQPQTITKQYQVYEETFLRYWIIGRTKLRF
jgi:hypothetical protein